MTTPIPDDRSLDQALHRWLNDGDEPPVDRPRQIDRIMDHVDETRQRHRLWPRNPFGRRAMHRAGGAEASFGSARAGVVVALTPIKSMGAVVALVAAAALLVAIAQGPATVRLAGAVAPSPTDEALFERANALWSGDVTAVTDVYAADAVRTLLWQDKVERISGSDDIAGQAQLWSAIDRPVPLRTRLPSGAAGEHRYVTVSPAFGGVPCVIWIEDERITRHDCILPMGRMDTPPSFAPVAPDAEVRREAISTLNNQGWRGDLEALEQAASADIIHKVAYDNTDVTHVGIGKYRSIASLDLPPVEKQMPDIDLPAPQGELRWANFGSVGGGTLCVFWAAGEQIVRHDCIVPTRSY
ncbi:MAG TPA: hypothetical protein VK987_08945 [Anaerolineae bacterium]|nr:hypothetical protein [Anaerolineae bacterium]